MGISNSHLHRLAAHQRTAKWADEIALVRIEHFDTRDQALAAESLAIQTEKPARNVQGQFKASKAQPVMRFRADDCSVMGPFLARIRTHCAETSTRPEKLLQMAINAEWSRWHRWCDGTSSPWTRTMERVDAFMVAQSSGAAR